MTLVFPASLPHFHQGSVQSAVVDNVVRTEMETGPQKQRLKDRVFYMRHSGEMRIKTAKLSTFLDFFNLDADQGCTPFEWSDPFTAATKMYRFIGQPSINHISGDLVSVSFTVEEIP